MEDGADALRTLRGLATATRRTSLHVPRVQRFVIERLTPSCRVDICGGWRTGHTSSTRAANLVTSSERPPAPTGGRSNTPPQASEEEGVVMTLRGRTARTQGRRTGLSIYVPIILSLGVIPTVCFYPYLAAPVSTAAAVLAASIPVLRTQRSVRREQSAANHDASDHDAAGRSNSS